MDEPVWSQWRRPGPTLADQRADVLLAVAVVASALAVDVLVNSMGAFVFGDTSASLPEQFAWGIAMSAPLVVRRTFPLSVLCVVSVLFIAGQVRQISDNLVPSITLFVAMYTAGAWSRDRARARWVRVGVIAAMFCWLGVGLVFFLLQPSHEFTGAAGPLDPVLASVLYNIGFNVLFFLSAYFFGNMAWLSARRQAELAWGAEQLRASQEQNTRGALVAERVRIARDLHDVVAHHVSVIGVQAGAARRVLDTDRQLASEALRTVEQTSRTTIAELRALLGVLRAGGTDTEPAATDTEAAPGLEQLPDLLDNARSAGLEVAHGVYGEERQVPEAVALSAYRVVQEALTNVVKHAGARKVDVRVRYLESALEVEVTDDGRRGAGAGGRAGFGLVGMRERVAVHGGVLEAGPRQDTGFLVRANLPTSHPATEDIRGRAELSTS